MTDHLASAARILKGARNGLAAATEKARVAAQQAAGEGVPETEIARELGVNRLTVRKWLGK